MELQNLWKQRKLPKLSNYVIYFAKFSSQTLDNDKYNNMCMQQIPDLAVGLS